MVVFFVGGGEGLYPCGGLVGGNIWCEFHIQLAVMILPAGVVAVVTILVVGVGEDGFYVIEGRVLWQIFIGAADADIEVVVDLYHLAHRVVLSEEGGGEGLRDDYGGGVLYSVAGAGEHPEAKHAGKIGFCDEGAAVDGFITVVEHGIAGAVGEGDAGEQILILCVIGFAEGLHDGTARVEIRLLVGVEAVHVEHSLGETLVVGGVVVEGVFVGDPEADDEGDGHADGEAGDIDGGIAAIFAEVADGEEEIIFEHVPAFEFCRRRWCRIGKSVGPKGMHPGGRLGLCGYDTGGVRFDDKAGAFGARTINSLINYVYLAHETAFYLSSGVNWSGINWSEGL